MPIQIQETTLYTIEEAAQQLNCTKQTIRNYLKQGRLKGKRISRFIFITSDSIAEAMQDYTPRPHQKDGKY